MYYKDGLWYSTNDGNKLLTSHWLNQSNCSTLQGEGGGDCDHRQQQVLLLKFLLWCICTSVVLGGGYAYANLVTL